MSALLLLCACAGPAALGEDGTMPSPDPLDRVDGETLYTRAVQLSRHGDMVRAEQYLLAAMDRGFPRGRALPLLLRVCISGSRLSAALHYAGPYLEQHPQDARLRYLVASVLLALGRADEARAQLARVLRDEPDHAEAHYLLGAVLRDLYGEEDQAAEHFASYARLRPTGVYGAEAAAWLREYRRQRASGDAERPHEEAVP